MKHLPILLLFFISSARASTYYFSSTLGNDSRSPTEAQNPATAWKSLEKLNSFFKSLAPGDFVLLKRGDVFYGTINITRSGAKGSPITIGAYGEGTKPVVTGFNIIKNWKSLGNGVWESSGPVTSLPTLNMVVINEKVQQIGRYPNVDAPNKGYLKISGHVGKNSITDIFLKLVPDWTGGDIVVRTSEYAIDRAEILRHSGNVFNLGDGLTYEPKYGYGYFIQNHPATLDQAGEWYFNKKDKKVQVFYGKNPSQVSVAGLNNLLKGSSINYIVLNNIQFSGANENAISIEGPGTDFSIQDCDIFFSGIDAIKSKGERNFVIQDCNIRNSLNEGISATDNTIVKGCSIRNSGFIAGMTQNNAGISAISNSGPNGVTENNTITNTGYIGIKFGRNNSTVKNNYIDSFCTIKQDGGAIYAQGKKGDLYSGTKINGNIILNGLGAFEGTTSFSNNAIGIYCDDYLNNIEVDGNTISGTGIGIKLHNNQNVIVTNNTCFNNSRCQLSIINDKLDYPTKLLVLKNNVFYSKNPEQYVACYNSSSNDFNSFGLMSDNILAMPTDKPGKMFRTGVQREPGVLYSSATLASAFPSLVKSSKEFLFSSGNASKVRLEINPTSQEKTITLNGSFIDPRNARYHGSISLPPYHSIILMKQN